MKKTILTLLSVLVLASCGDTFNSVSLVEGDVALNLLISDTLNPKTGDLGTPVFSLNDNPDLLIFDLPRQLEPGFQLSKYIKIRNEGNVAITYSGIALLNKPLEGEVFWFRMNEVISASEQVALFDTTSLALPEGHQFELPLRTLATRNEFDIYHLELIINPGLPNTFNVEGGVYELSFNLSYTANYLVP